MFKKSQDVNGLSFSMISKTDGSDISTGVVWADLVQDGGVFVDLIAAPKHRVNSLWTANISAAEMNYDLVSVTFKHADGIPVTYNIKTDSKLVSDLHDFDPATDTVVKANVYSINSNTDAAIQLQQKVPRIDTNVSSRSVAGDQMNLIDAPNSTAVTAIQNGLSTFDPATDTVVKANIYSINANTNSAVMLQQLIPRIDTNISSRSTFDYATDTVNANVTMVDGMTVEVADVVNANVYAINSNTDAAIMLQQFIPRIDTNVSSVDISGVVNANVYSINGNTIAAIQLQQFIPRIDTNISSRSAAGDQMNLVDAPNSTAITAIQNGLSTFDPATDLVVKANVYSINSNVASAIMLQQYIPRLDENVSSGSFSGTIDANVVSVQGVAVSSIDDFKADVSGLSTFNSLTDIVNANVYSINSNTDSAILLQSYVPRIDTNISSVGTTGLINANVYSINGNVDAAIMLQQFIPRLDDNVSTGSFSGTVDANVVSVQGVAVISIDDFKATGFSTFDPASQVVQANVVMVNGVDAEILDVVNANVYAINSNTEAAILLQSYVSRIDTNISSRAVPGAQMDLVNAPNSTAVTAIQNGLSTFDPATDTVVRANVYSINSNTDAAILLQSYIPRIDTNTSSRSAFDEATDIVKANVIQVAGTTVEIAGIVNANIAQIASNTAAAVALAQNVVRLDDNISSRSTFDSATDTVVKANVYSINSNTEAAVLLASSIPRIDANITSRSVAGDQMNLIDAPNSTAITAIQNGLSTFDSTTDLVNANVYAINSNTDAAILLQSYTPRLDDNISSRSTFVAATDTVKANVITINGISVEVEPFVAMPANIVSVQGVAVTSVNDFKATGFSTFDSATDTVNSNVVSIFGNATSAESLAANIHFLDSNISNITVNNTAIAQEIFNTAVDGSVIFSDAIKRILAMVVNAQIITGTDPITLVGRNSANTANVVIQTHPVADPTGRTVTFN